MLITHSYSIRLFMVFVIVMLILPILSIAETLDAKFQSASAVLQQGIEPDALTSALHEVLNVGKVLGRDSESLEQVNAFLARAASVEEFDDDAIQLAENIKGRLLARVGRVQESIRHFETMLEQGKADAFVFFVDTLKESGHFAEAVVYQFKWACQPEVIPDNWRNFVDQFFTSVRDYVVHRPHERAIETIYREIDALEVSPVYKSIALYFIHVADRNYPDAEQVISELENSHPLNLVDGYDESRNFPLYRAMLSLFNNEDESRVVSLLSDFEQYNADRTEYVLRMLLTVCRLLEKDYVHSGKRLWITHFLIESGFHQRSKYSPEITDEYWIAHLLDMHQSALYREGMWQEGEPYRKLLIEEHFPANFAGINAMYVEATIHLQYTQNYEYAEDCLKRIIDEVEDLNTVRKSKRKLLTAWRLLDRPTHQILELIVELSEHASPEEQQYFGNLAARLIAEDER